ncbi:MAG: D-alanyl-D-alanine carboxypeptidase family protein [Alphaproteobacteria bacterium]|nr:MAG: D-alanyl-D-alanine carboxypeptidase family protein [Alphaproteobacteria bacterium]
MSTLEFLTGRTTDHLVPFQGSKFLVHHGMLKDLERLFKSAAVDGIELSMTSSFRSYADQRSIWNNKVQGLRAVLDSNSIPVDISNKSKEEILFLILRWSAIPGASRHHWGSDIDVFDQKALPADYKVELIPSEYEENGPFYKANLWLSQNMSEFGFYRPYEKDIGGIAPEPWHLSYRPLSEHFLEAFSFLMFKKHLEQSDFLLLDEARLNSLLIYDRFINPE